MMRHRALTLDEAQVALERLAQGNRPRPRKERRIPLPPPAKQRRSSHVLLLVTAVVCACLAGGGVLLNNAAKQHAAFMEEVGSSVLGTVGQSQIRSEASQTVGLQPSPVTDPPASSALAAPLPTQVPRPPAHTAATTPGTAQPSPRDPAAMDREALAMLAGPKPDHAAAAVLLRTAAEAGRAAAQYNLGVLYDSGLGVPQDLTNAARWFTAAAEQGFAQAQYNLALAYASGRGVLQSYDEAAAWFQRAAERGIPAAAHNLGALYENGAGVAKSLPEAYSWYWVAVKLGEPEALSRLKAVGSRLSSRQREQAERTGESMLGSILKDQARRPTQ